MKLMTLTPTSSLTNPYHLAGANVAADRIPLSATGEEIFLRPIAVIKPAFDDEVDLNEKGRFVDVYA